MAFVNLSLLLGGLFVAVPIVLHLTMRRKPQKQTFPAVRFLKRRREANRRRLQLRHWLLLALRCGIVAVFALALARPSVDPNRLHVWGMASGFLALLVLAIGLLLWVVVNRFGRGWTAALSLACVILAVGLVASLANALRGGARVVLGNEQTMLSIVIVVDTSPRMAYLHQNRTRLEQAQDLAQWLLRQLPAGSRVAVMDTHPDPASFAVDLASAKRAVDNLRISAASEPLAATLEQAVELQQDAGSTRREVYIFSDLTAAAWPGEATERFAQRLRDDSELAVYIVDVGVLKPTNVAIGSLTLSTETIVSGSAASVVCDLNSVGLEASLVAEVAIEQHDSDRPIVVDGEVLLPELAVHDAVEAELKPGIPQRIRFQLQELPEGVHHGVVRVRSGDPLPVDDRRYFTIESRGAIPVLVVAPPGIAAALFVEAIAPLDLRQLGRARFEPTTVEQLDPEQHQPTDFPVVCLLDPKPLSPADWSWLEQHVQRGGGLAVFLGRNAYPPDTFNSRDAQRVLGCTLEQRWRAVDRELYLAPQQMVHPVLAPFRTLATSVPWQESPVYRHWVIDSPNSETDVVARYSNNQPAILETAIGIGRILTMTTPVTDPLSSSGRPPWNELPTSESAWPYVILMNEMIGYLAGGGNVRLNYEIGEPVVLPEGSPDATRYRLFAPHEPPYDVAVNQGRIVIRYTENPGAYRLKGDQSGPTHGGFSVNLPTGSTALRRLEPGDLDTALGENRYSYARRPQEILVEVGETRSGSEFYPFLLIALAVVIGSEQLLANRFYRE